MSQALSTEITPRLPAVVAGERSPHTRAAHLVRVWVAVVNQWKRQGTPTLERNLGAITRHYRDEGVILFLPPSQLVADWRDDGCPDPALWIDAKVAAILANGPGDIPAT